MEKNNISWSMGKTFGKEENVWSHHVVLTVEGKVLSKMEYKRGSYCCKGLFKLWDILTNPEDCSKFYNLLKEQGYSEV